MRFEIRRLHDKYRYTTVYVTHDQAEAMTTADLIVVMNQGASSRPEARGDLPAAAVGIRGALPRRHQHPEGPLARCRDGGMRAAEAALRRRRFFRRRRRR
jgi:energy-coupling factor transporter ATP-binding protein EcfA2